ncbi:PP0621 family protein [Undibacterium sp.]|uniref:PP0621 family protein n=1 Tax=Undibacterium sp. TaxID=1914977 RepID=UPI003752CF2C
MRMLMWLGLAVLVYLAIRKSMRANKPPANSSQTDTSHWSDETFGSAGRSAPNPNQSASRSETMLSCDHCQVYFPASEVVVRDTQTYCCAEHADAGSKTN